MCKWYKEMDCYILLSEHSPNKSHIDKISQRALLEQSYRNYAAVFDNVKLVIKNSQAKDYFLNFPHLCISDKYEPEANISTLLQDAKSDAIFVGYAGLEDFPISILSNLIKTYKGELFMGYKTNKLSRKNLPFGIYHKSLITQNKKTIDIGSLDKNSYRLLPLPETTPYIF